MSPLAPPDGSCSTVGDFIAGVVLKELWAVQLQQCTAGASGHAPTPFDPQAARDLLSRHSTSLARDVLDAARGWIPSVADVQPSTLLPDLDQFPASAQDAEGMSVCQRKLLLEALELVLDEPIADGTEAEHQPLLPRTSIACVSAQVAAALEHFALLQPQTAGPAHLREVDIDVSSWQRICDKGAEKPTPGSKQELIEELQGCRNRIFNLEREMVSQERLAASNASRQKRAGEKAISVLQATNRNLDDKLKVQGEEYSAMEKTLHDCDRRLTHEHRLAADKGKKIRVLEEELSRSVRMHEDLLRREKEYGKRILRLRVEEFAGLCRDHQRKKRLKNAILSMEISGQSEQAIKDAEPSEKDLADLARQTLDDLESEFDAFFADRQRKFAGMMAQHESSLEEKRARCVEAHSIVLEAHRAATTPSSGQARVRHATVQTDERPSPTAGQQLQEARQSLPREAAAEESLLSRSSPMPWATVTSTAPSAAKASRAATPSTRASSRASCLTPVLRDRPTPHVPRWRLPAHGSWPSQERCSSSLDGASQFPPLSSRHATTTPLPA